VRSSSINEKQVHSFVEGVFGEELHSKRVLSLALATLGVIHAASLSVYAIGQALAQARGTQGKHGVKLETILAKRGLSIAGSARKRGGGTTAV
jgi:hypothetical protein